MIILNMDTFPYEIRCAYGNEWQEAMGLAWKTFLKFESKDYSLEGIKNFNDFITDHGLYQMFSIGEYQLFVAVDQGKIVGIVTLRNATHISLLFVDEKYHKRGIASKLLEYLKQYLITEVGAYYLTVNSSPCAVGFYHKLGFKDLGPETTKDGILYTPMEKFL